MTCIRTVLAGGALLAIMTTGVLAQDPVAQGRELAQEWCTRCHNVEPGGPFKQFPPSFASIAVYRSPEQIYGRIAVPPLHSNMPQVGYILTSENISHLVEYIRSLEVK